MRKEQCDLARLLTQDWHLSDEARRGREIDVPPVEDGEVDALIEAASVATGLDESEVRSVAEAVAGEGWSARRIARDVKVPEPAVWPIACACIERRHGFKFTPGMSGALLRATRDVLWAREHIPDLPVWMVSHWACPDDVPVGEAWKKLKALERHLGRAEKSMEATAKALASADTVLDLFCVPHGIKSAVAARLLDDQTPESFADSTAAVRELLEQAHDLRAAAHWKEAALVEGRDNSRVRGHRLLRTSR